MKKKFLLIDGYSIICRGFYALPLLSTKSGKHTNACLGFFNIFYKVFDEEKPDYIAVAFDENKPTFRHEIFKDYKGQRGPMPEELKEQVPYVKNILSKMNIMTVSMEGFEADDILGTLSNKFINKNLEAVILSGDRDMLQLATENIKIRLVKTLNNQSNTLNYYEEDVYNELKVTPLQFIDVKALMGDTSDNIKGITGVGEKTALSLIQEYNSIDGIYENIDCITKKKLHDNLLNEKEDCYFYKKLVTIVKDVPLNFELGDFSNFNTKSDEVKNVFLEYEINSIYKKLGGKIENKQKDDDLLNLFNDNKPISNILDDIDLDNVDLIKNNKSLNDEIINVDNKNDLGKAFDEIINESNKSNLAFHIKEINDILEIYLFYNQKAYKIEQVLKEDFIKYLNKSLKNTNINFWTFGLKEELKYFDKNYDNIYDYFYNEDLCKINDISIIRYIINPTSKILYEKNKLISYYNHIDNYIDLLKKYNLYDLYKNIDYPLLFVLYNMEKIGIKIENNSLLQYEKFLSKEVDKLEKDIIKIAGKDFNIKSPKQLSEVLYVDLKIPYPEKNNKMSTSADILEKLIDEHPIIEKIMNYRTYTKLLDTYAIGLRKFIENDDRIHTTFNQIETATGRLSSENPNLQNIPIRTEIGKKLRDIFIPRDGFIFLDADYSQIELRVLAILSKDKNMTNDFIQNKDIHTSTASKIFKIKEEDVDSILRRKAKAVNFGLVYGISSFGLGEDLHISSKEAKDYMTKYFENYKDIKNYLDDVVEEAKSNYYTKTFYNRIRPIYEFKTGNQFQKAFAKRVAMNSSIQGTAADIIKIAMIGIDKDLRKEKLQSRILLQVHDEVLLECKIEEINKVKEILIKNMKNNFKFDIELNIDINEGNSWGEAH